MSRRYGRAARGERCHGTVPHGHWQTATLLAALRHDRLCAPWVLDGPLDGAAFLVYLRQVLAPELAPGDLVICDNLACHKVAGAAAAVAACGAELLYLPAYSPDLNPIEPAFAQLKAGLRRAARRTLPALLQATGRTLAACTPAHCRGFFRHAQYATD